MRYISDKFVEKFKHILGLKSLSKNLVIN